MPLTGAGAKVVHPDRNAAVAVVLDKVKPDFAVIGRRTFTTSAAGGETETLVVVAAAVPVRIRRPGRAFTTGTAGDQASESERWELGFPLGSDVRAATDRIFVGARTFDVLESGSESLEPEMRVLAVEVTA